MQPSGERWLAGVGEVSGIVDDDDAEEDEEEAVNQSELDALSFDDFGKLTFRSPSMFNLAAPLPSPKRFFT